MNKNILISKDLLYKKIHIKYKKWKEKNARHKNILLFNRKLGISRFVPVQKKEELLENNRCIICQQDNPIKYHFISQDNEGIKIKCVIFVILIVIEVFVIQIH